MSEVPQNDADKRPRIYGRVDVNGGEIELTVQGSEGESTEDLKETFEAELDELEAKAREIQEDPDSTGVA